MSYKNYKIGDKVKLKKYLNNDEEYGDQIFSYNMREFEDKELIIEDVIDRDYGGGYWIEGCRGYFFTDEMLEPVSYFFENNNYSAGHFFKQVEKRIKEINLSKELDRKCIQCGSENYLIELQNGKFGCQDCLEKIGKEQKALLKVLKSYFKKYDIYNVQHQIKALEAIILHIKNENLLLDEHETYNIKKEYEKQLDAIVNVCDNCEYALKGYPNFPTDIVCGCENSDYLTDFVNKGHSCDFFRNQEKGLCNKKVGRRCIGCEYETWGESVPRCGL